MVKGCNIFWVKIGKHLQLCERAHYLDEPVECPSGADPLRLYKILHLLLFPLVRILCALRLESRIKLSTWSWCGTFGISVSSAEGMSLEPIQNSVAFFWSQAKHQVSLVLIIQQDATSKWFILHLVTLYMFRVTIPPIIRGTMAVSAASGISRLHVAQSPTAFRVLFELTVLW